MNKQTHTPGPWNRGYGNYVYRGSTQESLIATCMPRNGTLEELETAFANARLIAAAPDMLTALQRFSEAVKHGHYPELQGIANDAFAAIAKATGTET